MFSYVPVGRLKNQIINFSEHTFVNLNASVFEGNNYAIHPLLLTILQEIPFELVGVNQSLQRSKSIDPRAQCNLLRF